MRRWWSSRQARTRILSTARCKIGTAAMRRASAASTILSPSAASATAPTPRSPGRRFVHPHLFSHSAVLQQCPRAMREVARSGASVKPQAMIIPVSVFWRLSILGIRQRSPPAVLYRSCFFGASVSGRLAVWSNRLIALQLKHSGTCF